MNQSQLEIDVLKILRVIQAYEQREKGINKVSEMNIKQLADVLHCYIEDLIEEETYG